MAEPKTTPVPEQASPASPAPEPVPAGVLVDRMLATQAKPAAPAPTPAPAPTRGMRHIGGGSSQGSTGGGLRHIELAKPREQVLTPPAPDLEYEGPAGSVAIPGDRKATQKLLEPYKGQSAVSTILNAVASYMPGKHGYSTFGNLYHTVTDLKPFDSLANILEPIDTPRRLSWKTGAFVGQALPDSDSGTGAALKKATGYAASKLIPQDEYWKAFLSPAAMFAASKATEVSPLDKDKSSLQQREELWQKVGERFYDFVASGAAIKAARSNPDDIKMLGLLGFDDTSVDNLTGKMILDHIVSKEEASRALLTVAPKSPEHWLYALLMHDSGRELLGGIMEGVLDPLNFTGVAGASKIISVGSKQFRISGEVVSGASKLAKMGVSEAEAQRLLVRASQGDMEAFGAVDAAFGSMKEQAHLARASADAVTKAKTPQELLEAYKAAAEAGGLGGTRLATFMPGVERALASGGKAGSLAEKMNRAKGFAATIAREIENDSDALATAWGALTRGGHVAENYGPAMHLPFGAKTYYPAKALFKPVSEIRAAAGAELASHFPKLYELDKMFTAKGGYKAASIGEKLAYAGLLTSTIGQKAARIPLYVWDMMARHMGSRLWQPLFVSLADVKWVKDKRELQHLAEMVGSETLVLEARRARKVMPEVWDEYQSAMSTFLENRASRASDLRHAWSRAVKRAKEVVRLEAQEGRQLELADVMNAAWSHIERGSGALPDSIRDVADELGVILDDFRSDDALLAQAKQALQTMGRGMMTGDPDIYERLVRGLKSVYPEEMSGYLPYQTEAIPEIPKMLQEELKKLIPRIPVPDGIDGPEGGRIFREWEAELWKRAKPLLGSMRPDEVALACMSVLHDEKLLPADIAGYEDLRRAYPHVIGRRLGDLPLNIAELVEELKGIIDQHQELVARYGLAQVATPEMMLQKWGVVNYVPHVSLPSNLTASGRLRAMADAQAGHGRVSRGGSLASALNSDIAGDRQRKLRGTLDEINAMVRAGEEGAKVEFSTDIADLMPRWAQIDNAAASVEMLWMLIDSGVAKAFRSDPEAGRSALQAAALEGYLPLMHRERKSLDYDVALFGARQELERAGITPEELEAAAQDAMPNEARQATWAQSIPLIEQAHRIEANLLLIRASDMQTGRELLSLRDIIGHPAGASEWEAAAETFNLAAQQAGRAFKVTAQDLQAYLGESGASFLYFPGAVVQSMHDMLDLNRWALPGPGQWVKEKWDAAQSWVKTRFTVPVILFHMRNAITNELNNALTLGMKYFSPKTHLEATQLMTATGFVARYGSLERASDVMTHGFRPGESTIDHIALMRDRAMWEANRMEHLVLNGIDMGDGTLRTGTEAVKELMRRGIVTDAYSTFADAHHWHNDLLDMIAATTPDQAWATMKKWASVAEDVMYVGTSMMLSGGFPVVLPKRIGRDIAQFIEGRSRLVNFLGVAKDSKSLDQAAESVSKWLFNYEDLTGFQKVIGRSLFTFFTWPFKNFELHAKLLLERPAVYAAYWRLLLENIPAALGDYQDELHGREPNHLSPTHEYRQKLLDPHERFKARLPMPWLSHGMVTSLGLPLESAAEYTAGWHDLFTWMVSPLVKTLSGDPLGGVKTWKEGFDEGKALRLFSQFSVLAAVPVQMMLNKNFYADKKITDINNAAQAQQIIEGLYQFKDVPIIGDHSVLTAEAFKRLIKYQETVKFSPEQGKFVRVGRADPYAMFVLHNVPWRLNTAAAISDTAHLDMLTIPASADDIPSFERIPLWWRLLDGYTAVSIAQENDAYRVKQMREKVRDEALRTPVEEGVIGTSQEVYVPKR